jgi:competence protein ComFC
MAESKEKLLSLFYPARCPFCGGLINPDMLCCAVCENKLYAIEGETCKKCGREKPHCFCRGKRYEFSRCVSPFYYEGAAKNGILRLKFHGKRNAAGPLAAYLTKTVQREYSGVRFDFVTAVPLSGEQLKERGYNQAQEIALKLCANIGVKYSTLLLKPYDTKPQRECRASERWGNVFGAFQFSGEKIDGKTVLLVDDVTTTGATLNECAKMLRLTGGASSVYCAVEACVKKPN